MPSKISKQNFNDLLSIFFFIDAIALVSFGFVRFSYSSNIIIQNQALAFVILGGFFLVSGVMTMLPRLLKNIKEE